jgi:hypothetical protein
MGNKDAIFVPFVIMTNEKAFFFLTSINPNAGHDVMHTENAEYFN